MRTILAVHILAGSLGLISGFVALYAAKGATVHRKSGMVFVYTIMTMAFFGLVIAAGWGRAPAVNVPAALLTSYLVITSLTTVRPPARGGRWLLVGGLAVILLVTLADITFGIEAVANGGKREGIPAFPFFLFGFVGILGSTGDFKVLRSGALRGSARIARHLWRMSFALFIAALSFFLGQAKVIPKPIRIGPLLAAPPLIVLVAMFYWLWRVRTKRPLRMVGVETRERVRDNPSRAA